MAARASGSSPLARGLQQGGHQVAGGGGIIPARAGFTSTPATTSRSWRDHPRSRGVYLTTQGAGYLYRGSSPLARGLHLEDDEFWDAVGIIPARAGFTRPQRRAPSPGPDHPRSRGVYRCPTWLMVNCTGSSPLARGLRMSSVLRRRRAGSSPLARGLRAPGAGQLVGSGIIPARAGFTAHRRRLLPRAGDHPRSRGVYETGR